MTRHVVTIVAAVNMFLQFSSIDHLIFTKFCHYLVSLHFTTVTTNWTISYKKVQCIVITKYVSDCSLMNVLSLSEPMIIYRMVICWRQLCQAAAVNILYTYIMISFDTKV